MLFFIPNTTDNASRVRWGGRIILIFLVAIIDNKLPVSREALGANMELLRPFVIIE